MGFERLGPPLSPGYQVVPERAGGDLPAPIDHLVEFCAGQNPSQEDRDHLADYRENAERRNSMIVRSR